MAVVGASLGAVGCLAPLRLPEPPRPTYVPDFAPSQPVVRQTQYQETEQLPPRADERAHVVTLPQAVHESVYANLRLRARGEKVSQAMAELTTSSIIPNSQLFWDYQFIPLQHTDIFNQAGPPQTDLTLTIPLDWFLFGKRVAAMEAARLGVDVATFDLQDFVRKHVAETVDAFYEHLQAKELSKLAHEDLADLQRIEEMVKKQVGAGGTGAIEADRARLAVLDALQEAHKRDLDAATTKAKLRPLLGRSAADSDFEVDGTLVVSRAAKPPDLPTMLALAEQNRPNLLSDRKSIDQAWSSVESERRKGRPQLSIQHGLSGQIQRRVTGFPNAISYDVGLTTTLPLTDRNQGNIAKARSQLRENCLTLEADTADAWSEVETALRQYHDAFERVTREDPEVLKTARSLRDRTEAAFKQAGGRRLIEVLDAQRAYRERMKTVISNRGEYWKALNALNAAAGLRGLEDEGLSLRP
jgi:outer membrane protein, heavy metal efflux system